MSLLKCTTPTSNCNIVFLADQSYCTYRSANDFITNKISVIKHSIALQNSNESLIEQYEYKSEHYHSAIS